ncbi:hypothetical protein KVH31_34790 [Streptomyces olivaceus]|uniref:hypothetical protein n=1 Tax=Streptomyces olivaceus TaxID=47716 RepID=UPI001CCF4340|nr:hypothetical protein [Streptomyces olivaceus]MBZ6211666.1 hypothetical protein [Streptomyces olivaceus]
MRRTVTAVTAALLAVLLTGGCSDGNGGGDGKADASPAPATSTPADEPETAAPKLSEEWGPKLQAATRSSRDDVCKTVGSKPCVEHITTLTELVYDVRDAIDTAGAGAAYPKTLAAVDDVEEASGAYAEGGCAGSSEATLLDGSVCGGYVAALLLGPSMLDIRMTTDELAAP